MRHPVVSGLLLAVAMVTIFMLYQHPAFLWMLASQAWSCF